MKRSNEQSLKEALEALVDGYGLRERLDEQAIVAGWKEVTGDMVARHTRALKLRKGTLHVKVDSAPLRVELTHQRSTLMERFNERFARTVIQAILVE